MPSFVCVRVIQANAMDLGLFQFDYDMSFGVTFLHADKTVLARYGTRRGNEEEASADMSMEGLRETMRSVLALHRGYPTNRKVLAGKQPHTPVSYPVPEAHPLLNKFQSHLDYEGKVAGSCIHCHQVRDVERRALRDGGERLSRKMLTPYPMPALLGIEMDPKTAATVASVATGSEGERAGLRAGDVVITMRGQAVASLADMQWVLHHVEEAGPLTFRVRRDGEERDLVLRLGEGWSEASDIGWRVSTWDLRRMAFGGMYLESLTAEERRAHGAEAGTLALRAKHVGQYGEHAVAKRAGLKKGDVIVSFDGIDRDLSESVLIREVLGKRRRGEEVEVRYLRDGKPRQALLRLQ